MSAIKISSNTVDRPSVDKIINEDLQSGADVSTIMSTILGKFKNTDATFDNDMFRSVICKNDDPQKNKIRGYDAFLTQSQYNALKQHDDDLKRQYATLKNSAEENYLSINEKYAKLEKSNYNLLEQNAELEKVDEYFKAEYAKLDALKKIPKLWRITHTLFSLCESIQQNGSGDCSLAKILEFYDKYKDTNAEMNALTREKLAEKLNHLKDEEMRGGNQKGGDMAQIATLLAGIDAAVSKISSLTESAYKTLCELCKKAADFISSFPLSKCLQIIMGDILYASMKNVIDVAIDIQPGLFETGARATIGLLGPYAVYTNRMALLNVLSSMISYLPQAGGLCVATVAGVIVFNTSMQAIEKAPSVAETSIILKEYISTLNNLDASDIITGFTKLQKIISNHLTAASKAGDTQKEQALEEFRATITEILNNADLTPKALAESSTRKDEQDIMTINIRKSIFANLESKFADCKDITVPGCLDRAKQIVELGDAIIKDAAVVNTTIVDEGKKIKVDKINVDAIRATVTAEEARLTEKERSAEKERRRAINQAIAERINRDETAKAAVRAANALKRKQDNNDLNSRNAADTIKTNLIHQIQNTAVTNAAINAAKKPKIKGEEPDVINFGGKPRRKTTRKPHKKNNKKSRKHRRSRKH